jgi:hypothetical protein
MFNAVPRPHYPGKRHSVRIVQETGRALRPVWTDEEILALTVTLNVIFVIRLLDLDSRVCDTGRSTSRWSSYASLSSAHRMSLWPVISCGVTIIIHSVLLITVDFKVDNNFFLIFDLSKSK